MEPTVGPAVSDAGDDDGDGGDDVGERDGEPEECWVTTPPVTGLDQQGQSSYHHLQSRAIFTILHHRIDNTV